MRPRPSYRVFQAKGDGVGKGLGKDIGRVCLPILAILNIAQPIAGF